MNFPRVALAAVVSWLVYLAVSFLVHGLLLSDLYARHAGRTRQEDDQAGILPVALALALVGFFAFAYAYAKGYEGGRGTQEGLRFGVLVGLMLCSFAAIFQYMVWPVSETLLLAWLLDYVLEFALYGIIVGLVYRPAGAPLRRTIGLV
ncbi:MAG TPA: hypothetical protein VD833_18780 [Vicinamibacterales bacterium]|nr:hypothetical protein [Vicinamibacterales bacterium]